MASQAAKLRRVIVGASAGVAIFVAAPMFYWLGSIVTRKRPACAVHVTGTWIGVTPEGEIIKLRFNDRGVAALDSPTQTARGPVKFQEDGASFTVEPIIPFIGGTNVSCNVSRWPQSSADSEVLVVDGVELRKPTED